MTGAIEFPLLGPKWAIGSVALAHTMVAVASIGFSFIVTVAQIAGYRRKDRALDLFAKRIQLYHVCIYNIGTILAIGLIFALGGLYPQFWSQLFVHLFWTLILEEFLFFLLATTLTFHYFFWENMWGHKKLQIFMGALLTPLFLLQFYLINGIGAFMLTPGFSEGQADLAKGILGWDKLAFYNPSFLMLTFHRAFANIAYGGYVVAGLCAIALYFVKSEKRRRYYLQGARLSFFTAFVFFLSLPIIGYFYAWVLKYHAAEAYTNLMWGKGDIVAGGVDWWWLKHIVVIGLFGMSMSYFYRTSAPEKEGQSFALPRVMIYAILGFYLMMYVGMGLVMTWAFFWWMAAFGVAGWFLGSHLLAYHKESPHALFFVAGILSFATVGLGGYSREDSRPRFEGRISAHDKVYVPTQRAPYLMVDVDPATIPPAPPVPPPAPLPVRLIREKCIGCHTLERVQNYRLDNWDLIVRQMRAYGADLTNDEAKALTEYLEQGKPY